MFYSVIYLEESNLPVKLSMELHSFHRELLLRALYSPKSFRQYLLSPSEKERFFPKEIKSLKQVNNTRVSEMTTLPNSFNSNFKQDFCLASKF